VRASCRANPNALRRFFGFDTVKPPASAATPADAHAALSPAVDDRRRRWSCGANQVS
jgi:hypothetical protein